nr:heme-binding protein 1-like isoform X1 [Anolis sagrei ordinatus]
MEEEGVGEGPGRSCAMSGDGGLLPPPLGAITLEQLQGDFEEEEEEEEEGCQEEDRLLAYWQGVGRGHQVDVPPDMAEPIQQLTRNNQQQDRETVPFTVINRKEKFGELLYEKRHYGPSKWACVNAQEEQYEQSICLGFMKIMRYICEQNSSGLYLGMTIPIVTVVHTEEAMPDIRRLVTVAYRLPSDLQDRPPEPCDPDISIQEWPPATVYARGFRGVTNEGSIAREINFLAELLESPELCVRDTFLVAGYTNPAAANRQNEIWFLEKPEAAFRL